jgi:hypothetical protein
VIISETQLQIFVIYENPRDLPRPCFVTRMWIIEANGEQRPSLWATVTNTIEEARSTVPDGLYRLDRSPTDDPGVVETWL